MKKKKLLISGLLTALLIAGGLFYWYYKQTPKYALLQVKEALADHDFALFEQYVDMEAVMTSLIDQVMEINKNTSTAKNEWEQLGQNIGTGLVNLLKPQLSTLYKQQIQKLVETGKFETGSANANVNYSLPDIWKHSNADKTTGIEYVKEEGKIAYIGIGIKQDRFDTVLVFNIKLHYKGDHWQVAELMDVARFQKMLDELEEKRTTEINRPINKEMYNSLKISNYYKQAYTDGYWGYDKKVKMLVEMENIGSKAISEYSVTVTISDLSHTINSEFTYRY